MSSRLKYGLWVCLTTATVSPFIFCYLYVTYSTESESGLIWLAGIVMLAIGLCIALMMAMILQFTIRYLSGKLNNVKVIKLYLSLITVLALCILCGLFNGWHFFMTEGYKMTVVYIMVSVACVWIYPLKILNDQTNL